MANEIALTTANTVRVVKEWEFFDIPCEEAITPGEAVRLATDTGKITGSNDTDAAEGRTLGVASSDRIAQITAGLPVHVVKRGVMAGWDLSAMNYDAVVYLSDTDGRLSTVAGSTGKVVGRVVPLCGELSGSGFAKGILIDL